jgi:membrane protein YqaA with SNARE-associated domain
MARGKNFFPMARGEKFALAVLVLFAAASFLPLARDVEVAGMALFGWLMAALMILSPILTLCVLRRGRRRF